MLVPMSRSNVTFHTEYLRASHVFGYNSRTHELERAAGIIRRREAWCGCSGSWAKGNKRKGNR